MSGWDEGAVFYSEQAQFPGGGGGGDGSRHSVLIKLKEFIRSFSSGPNVLPYRESLINDPKFLLVHFDHLDAFDPDVSDLLRYSPADYLPLFDTAAAQVLAGLKSKVTGKTGETEEPPPSEVQILLTSKEDPISMRTLGAPYISKLVKIGGITIAASRTKAKATYVKNDCCSCKIDEP